jgi:DNA-binding winged helix-turn-helix (wHTH) protein/tetratricopeptide (TPR) repeat protein
VHLERIPFELLCLLVERNGELVTRGEIVESIWGKDVYLDAESAVSTAVRKVRQALNDNPEAARFIATVPARGYRFVATVHQAEPVPSDPTPQSSQKPTATPAPAASREPPRNLRVFIASAAILLVAMGIVAFLRLHRAQPLTQKDTIILADFANSTGDPVFDSTLKQGLAVELGQSPLLNILPDQKVRSTLLEMTRSPDEPLTESLAREVCERTGSTAYIAGSVANLGGQYVIGLNAADCATGDGLAREQTEAVGKQQVLAALGAAADRLRVKLGESVGSIQRFDVPLAQATTSSLEALRAYSLGLSTYGRGDQTGAIPLFQRAIELDPDFAMAYANLGRAYQVVGQIPLSDEAIRKAFALRNRTSERERFDISAVYDQFVTMQTEEAIRNCEVWEQTYPRDFTPHRILGFENAVLGKYEQSAEEFRRAMELDPSQELPYDGLMAAYMASNRLPDAHATYQQAQAHKVDAGETQYQRYMLAFLEGDEGTMARMAASQSSQGGREVKALMEESDTAAYVGQLRAAQELSRRIEDKALSDADRATAADIESDMGLRAAFCGNWEGARNHAAAGIRIGGQPAMPLALSGELAEAAKAADFLAKHAPPGGFVNQVSVPEIRAAIELKRGNPTRAVELLAPVAPYEAGWFDNYRAAYLRGQAYLTAHNGQAAAAEFQKILDHRGVVLNSLIGALARLQLGRAYALQGDTAKARAAYQDFLALWKDANPDIPILVQAKAEYAQLR